MILLKRSLCIIYCIVRRIHPYYSYKYYRRARLESVDSNTPASMEIKELRRMVTRKKQRL